VKAHLQSHIREAPVKGREPFGYVVAIDGPTVTLNLNDTHRGDFALTS